MGFGSTGSFARGTIYSSVFKVDTNTNLQTIVQAKEPPTMHYMTETVRSSASKNMRYRDENKNTPA